MSILTAADRADLLTLAAEAQPDHSLILRRYNPNTDDFDVLAAQDVQVVYAQRQAREIGMVGVNETRDDVTFYREAPFDVEVDDRFSLDGHRGGRITSVTTDPVIGMIGADGTYETGRTS